MDYASKLHPFLLFFLCRMNSLCRFQSNDEGSKLFAELFRTVFLIVGELYGLAEIKREDAENGLAVHLVSARFKIDVTVKSHENIDEFVNIVDLFELDIECHGFFLSEIHISFPIEGYCNHYI